MQTVKEEERYPVILNMVIFPLKTVYGMHSIKGNRYLEPWSMHLMIMHLHRLQRSWVRLRTMNYL